MTRDEVRELILALPETEEGLSWGYPSFKAGGKFLTRIRDEDDSVIVYVSSVDERDMLIEAAPDAYHLTDHYRAYPIVLARIGRIDRDWFAAHILRRWRRLASKQAVKAWDAAHPRPV
ncbi:MAG: MmcQ/YjbR family DNA-binding protein [Caulobacteraceae bacterium]|nr:MmcQ/YjbR family DNA-binding protein [Caulobacteraceae bacterium]